ncbi:MAG: 50S ribosomal protein L22 [Firmicutes bacterium]|nr:50S ribosomal protein L22 [Bacillota bacterium]
MATRIKEKAAKIAQTREKRPHAIAKHIRISPSKVNVVLDTVRGKTVNDALALLESTPKSAAEPITKLINSAVANAEHNLNIPRIDLFVAEVYSGAGPILKRTMPRAKGRAYRINKRTSHITVILDTLKEVK